MRSKLNPDGARIRILRIQRGWTQEQLAEIAGISSRTVQRAETANCASFDTVKAIAAAFETDFDQLLGSEACRASDPGPQIASRADIPNSEPEIEPIPADHAKPSMRRMWTMPLLGASTLFLGLAIGAMLTAHFNKREQSHSSRAPGIAAVSRPAEILKESMPLATVARQEMLAIRALSQSKKPTAPKPPVIAAKSPLSFSPVERRSEILVTEEPDLGDVIKHSHAPASIDLPLHSHTLLSELIIPATTVPPGELPAFSGNSTLNEPEIGTVRQAMDLAAKKTGTFVSKVEASIKRVF
jgi:transcriptional regulator with XRE-family HTH domain